MAYHDQIRPTSRQEQQRRWELVSKIIAAIAWVFVALLLAAAYYFLMRPEL